MNRNWLAIGLMSLMLSGAAYSTARAEDKESDEVKVSMKQVPRAVRKTLKREANGAGIKSVDKEKLNGKTVYEADVMIDGHNYEIVVDEDGVLQSKKLDEEEGEKAEAREGKKGREVRKDKEDEDEKPHKQKKQKEDEEQEDKEDEGK